MKLFLDKSDMKDFKEVKFLSDSMLGRLSKWLRIMAYDTHYQSFYTKEMVSHLVDEGRILLSRHKPTVQQYPDSFHIRSDHVREQLHEMKSEGYLILDRSNWFTRCLTCNEPLKKAKTEDARENVPEYVFHKNINGIRFCTSCNRYFWPGNHRKNMIKQLEEWGFK